MSLNTIWDFYPSCRLSESAAYIYIWASLLTPEHLLFYLKGFPEQLHTHTHAHTHQNAHVNMHMCNTHIVGICHID